MQFINLAVVILLVNFKLELIEDEQMLFGFVPILNGDYDEFTVNWYYKIGATLCITLMINIFSPHASKIF